jgi:cell volume regulation protein A
MEFTEKFMFVGGLLLCLSIFAGMVSSRASIPILLIFLGVGVLFGESGPGHIVFNNFELSYVVCSTALVIILFDGGLHTSMRQFRIGVRPAASLATLGVLLTALLISAPLMLLLGFPFLPAFLVGATVASTDAAAVFMMLHHQKIKLRPRLISILETESGLNDPMAVLLTIGIAEFLRGDADAGILSFLEFFLLQMGIGAAVGYGGGKLMSFLLRNLILPSGLYPILGVAGALMIFGGSGLLHGSGFLAVYLSGLIVGNRAHKAKRVMSDFMDGTAWLSQMVMLLLLGLLVSPAQMAPDIPAALIAAVTLIFFARPAAVFISLAASRLSWREKAFISWVGLRGAVPIYLALVPSLVGVDGAALYFNAAFAIVIFSLILQGWTIRPAAVLLGLEGGAEAEPETAAGEAPAGPPLP